ncbi:MAG: AEC family transporter [Roseicyclus sp.]|uniref:AEC family transporter n=1 Tax=Boseongicola sp. H5 TaxID=2763261 RepID=UPI001B184A3F|nr:AEC family transporter [Roseicyclus sp.]MBO6625920.1 AEC family transporter [Roseicyclus sp.]MBO6923626.1 AEC family transporter [Roseicyclus sp.]
MLQTLADPILPVFLALVTGYALRLGGVMDDSHAAAINRFAFYLAVPALIVSVVGKAPVNDVEWPAVGVYFTVQMMLYLGMFAFLRTVLRLPVAEALLLGMATSFVNHIFFVLPIAERLVGPDAGVPMAGLVMLDAGVIFPATVLATAILTAGSEATSGVVGLVLKNPFVYASPIGIAVGLSGDAAPSGIMTFAEFAGAAAAPVLLFTLGLTLAGSSLARIGPEVWSVVAVKLLVHPALVGGLLGIVGVSRFTSDITLLVAAGPCGAMPFVIATQYGVRTEAIAKAVLISTLLSILSLAILTA